MELKPHLFIHSFIRANINIYKRTVPIPSIYSCQLSSSNLSRFRRLPWLHYCLTRNTTLGVSLRLALSKPQRSHLLFQPLLPANPILTNKHLNSPCRRESHVTQQWISL